MGIKTMIRDYFEALISLVRRFTWRGAIAKPIGWFRWGVAVLAEGWPSFLIAVPIGILLAATAYCLLLPRNPEILRAVFAPRNIDIALQEGIVPYGQAANKPRLVIDVVRSHNTIESVLAQSHRGESNSMVSGPGGSNSSEDGRQSTSAADTRHEVDARAIASQKTKEDPALEETLDAILRDGKRNERIYERGKSGDGNGKSNLADRLYDGACARWQQASEVDARIVNLGTRPIARLKEKAKTDSTSGCAEQEETRVPQSSWQFGYVCRYIVRREGTGTPTDVPDDGDAAADQQQYSNGQLLVIEVRQVATERDGKVVAAVVVDIGMRTPAASKPDAGKSPERVEADWVRLPWHETKNIAREGSYLARFELADGSWGRFMRFPSLGSPVSLSYPTSGQSVAEWIVGHFSDVSVSVNPDYKKRALRHSKKELELVAGDLERLLDEDWGHLTTDPYVSALRVVNGSIQFCTVSAFFAALAILLCRILMVWVERGYLAECSKSVVAGPTVSVFDRFCNWVEGHEKRHRVRWRHPSYVLQLYADAVAAAQGNAQEGQLPGFVNSFTGAQIARSDSNGFAWRFLVGALAGLGFLGTVWGIGQALMGTGSVLSSELAKQQAGVMSVSMTLGTAFDTTFVALLLTLIASAIGAVLVYLEESTIHAAGREFLSRVAPYVDHTNIERRAVDVHGADLGGDAPPEVVDVVEPPEPIDPDRPRRRYWAFSRQLAFGFAAVVLGAIVLNYVFQLLFTSF